MNQANSLTLIYKCGMLHATGYKNKRVSEAVIDQINTMPQIASRFLYDYKVLLSEKIVKANEKIWRKGVPTSMSAELKQLKML
jgi:4-aminobutyrate aminotransferase-like enzyme